MQVAVKWLRGSGRKDGQYLSPCPMGEKVQWGEGRGRCKCACRCQLPLALNKSIHKDSVIPLQS